MGGKVGKLQHPDVIKNQNEMRTFKLPHFTANISSS